MVARKEGARREGRTNLPVGQGIKDSFLDAIGMVVQTHMLQHHHATKQESRRVRKSLPRDIGRGTMHGLEDRAFVADVARGRQTKTADQTGAHVGQDVAVQIRHDEHLVVVGRGIGDDLQTSVVQQLGIELDVGKVLADLPRDGQEQAVGHLHDGRFVHRPHFSLADVLGVLEGEAQDAFRGRSRDQFDALHDAVDDDVLNARVLAFGVLADQGDVDVVVGGFVAGDGFAGAHVGEEVECSAEGEIEGDVTFAYRGLVLVQRCSCSWWKWEGLG